MLHTTFRLARSKNACKPGYNKLRAALGPEYGDDAPIPLTRVLEINGVADAIWCLRATLEDSDTLARLFAADCADHVLHLFEARFPNDDVPRKAIAAARAYARGEISSEELAAAARAARAAAAAAWEADAADAAARAAAEAADAAARAAAWAAAARAADAADAAARAAWAAWAAAWAAAARNAERQWQAQRLRELLEGRKC